MKTISIPLVFFVLLFSACQKDSGTPQPVSLIFGGGNSGGIYYYKNIYLIKNGSLYQDSDHFTTNISFPKTPLAGSKYQIARPLFTSIPSYLLSDTGGNLGNVSSPIGYYLEIATFNKTIKWNLGPDTAEMPVQVRPYAAQLINIMNGLQ